MAPKPQEKTVLILDDDLGFAMWLGRALNRPGLQALPATTSEEAMAIAQRVEPTNVHLVIANLAIAGSCWRRSQRRASR
jgi:ActR/RegA family two-component response regulator